MRGIVASLLPVVVAVVAALVLSAPIVSAANQDFTVVNSSNLTINSIYVTTANSSNWQNNLLHASSTIASGETTELQFSKPDEEASVCKYDVKAVSDEGQTVSVWSELLHDRYRDIPR
jgi:hypothetical protein